MYFRLSSSDFTFIRIIVASSSHFHCLKHQIIASTFLEKLSSLYSARFRHLKNNVTRYSVWFSPKCKKTQIPSWSKNSAFTLFWYLAYNQLLLAHLKYLFQIVYRWLKSKCLDKWSIIFEEISKMFCQFSEISTKMLITVVKLQKKFSMTRKCLLSSAQNIT